MPRSRPSSLQDWEDKDGENPDKRQKNSADIEAKYEEMTDETMGDPSVPSNDEGEVKDEEMTITEEPSPLNLDSRVGDHLVDGDFKTTVEGFRKEKEKDSRIRNFYLEGNLNPEAVSDLQQYLTIDLAVFLRTRSKRPYVPPSTNTSGLRLASQNYKFSKELTHTLDINAFLERLDEVRRWHDDSEERKQYLAPLLPVVQSSGTGKSRLLYEARKRLRKMGCLCRSILLTDQDPEAVKRNLDENEDKDEEIPSYDEVFKVEEASNDDEKTKLRNNFRTFVLNQCKEALENLKKKNDYEEQGPPDRHICLFFDEAQHLTVDKGFLFRVLRWIVQEIPKYREDPFSSFKITVVLAGTNSALTNFFPETEIAFRTSRYLTDSGNYYEEGQQQYSPFFHLRTQGCLASECGNNESKTDKGGPKESITEYEAMIPFSRPLFYLLHAEDKLGNDQEFDIALKIVLGKGAAWRDNVRSCLSVLATRVQMGVTSTDVVSDLVSNGYAHLTYFQNKSKIDMGIPSRASFSFLPDPVCARIAMRLTDATTRIQMNNPKPSSPRHSTPISGIEKRTIVQMMGRIFSTGLCLPAKGDVGEIAISLYLLFCGDVLRKKHNPPESSFQFSPQKFYQKLSVDVGSWLDLVWNGGESAEGETTPTQISSSSENPWNNFTINCIQFFRYSVRSSFAEMSDPVFLKSLYSKGCAIYCPTNFPAVDKVIPCCHCQQEKKDYLPVFFSDKNYAALYPGEAVNFLFSSWKALKEEGISKGLLFLAITGQDREDVDVAKYEEKWIEKFDDGNNQEACDALITRTKKKDFLQKLRVGFVCIHEDVFGIHKMLKDLSTVKDHQISDIYSVHSELIHKQEPTTADSVKEGQDSAMNMSQSYRKDATEFFTSTVGMVTTAAKEKASVQPRE